MERVCVEYGGNRINVLSPPGFRLSGVLEQACAYLSLPPRRFTLLLSNGSTVSLSSLVVTVPRPSSSASRVLKLVEAKYETLPAVSAANRRSAGENFAPPSAKLSAAQKAINSAPVVRSEIGNALGAVESIALAPAAAVCKLWVAFARFCLGGVMEDGGASLTRPINAMPVIEKARAATIIIETFGSFKGAHGASDFLCFGDFFLAAISSAGATLKGDVTLLRDSLDKLALALDGALGSRHFLMLNATVADILLPGLSPESRLPLFSGVTSWLATVFWGKHCILALNAVVQVGRAYAGSGTGLSFHRAMTLFSDLGVVRATRLPLGVWAATFCLHGPGSVVTSPDSLTSTGIELAGELASGIISAKSLPSVLTSIAVALAAEDIGALDLETLSADILLSAAHIATRAGAQNIAILAIAPAVFAASRRRGVNMLPELLAAFGIFRLCELIEIMSAAISPARIASLAASRDVGLHAWPRENSLSKASTLFFEALTELRGEAPDSFALTVDEMLSLAAVIEAEGPGAASGASESLREVSSAVCPEADGHGEDVIIGSVRAAFTNALRQATASASSPQLSELMPISTNIKFQSWIRDHSQSVNSSQEPEGGTETQGDGDSTSPTSPEPEPRLHIVSDADLSSLAAANEAAASIVAVARAAVARSVAARSAELESNVLCINTAPAGTATASTSLLQSLHHSVVPPIQGDPKSWRDIAMTDAAAAALPPEALLAWAGVATPPTGAVGVSALLSDAAYLVNARGGLRDDDSDSEEDEDDPAPALMASATSKRASSSTPPAVALAELDSALTSIRRALSSLSALANATYKWDNPVQVSLTSALYAAGVENSSVSAVSLPQSNVFIKDMARNGAPVSYSDVLRGAQSSLPRGTSAPALRAAVAWAEYHTALLESASADVRIELLAWRSMIDGTAASSSSVFGVAPTNWAHSSTLGANLGGDEGTLLGATISIPATSLHILPPRHLRYVTDIDAALSRTLAALDRCLSLRPPWPAALRDASAALSRRALLVVPAFIEAHASAILPGDTAEFPFPLPREFCPLSKKSSSINRNSDGRHNSPTKLEFSASRRVHSYFHDRSAARRFLEAARVAMSVSNTLGGTDSQARLDFFSVAAATTLLTESLPVVPVGDDRSDAPSRARLVATGSAVRTQGSEKAQSSLWMAALALPHYQPAHTSAVASDVFPEKCIVGLSKLGIIAATRLFRSFDSDGDGILNGAEAMEAFLVLTRGASSATENSQHASPLREIISRASAHAATLRWFSSQFSPTYLASRFDSFTRAAPTASVSRADATAPAVSVVVWAAPTPVSLRRTTDREFTRARGPIGNAQRRGNHIDGVRFSAHGSVVSRRTDKWSQAWYLYFAGVVALQRNVRGGISSQRPVNSKTMCLRAPTLTRRPAATYGCPPGIALPAFCEFVASLAATNPAILVAVLLQRGILSISQDSPISMAAPADETISTFAGDVSDGTMTVTSSDSDCERENSADGSSVDLSRMNTPIEVNDAPRAIASRIAARRSFLDQTSIEISPWIRTRTSTMHLASRGAAPLSPSGFQSQLSPAHAAAVALMAVGCVSPVDPPRTRRASAVSVGTPMSSRESSPVRNRSRASSRSDGPRRSPESLADVHRGSFARERAESIWDYGVNATPSTPSALVARRLRSNSDATPRAQAVPQNGLTAAARRALVDSALRAAGLTLPPDAPILSSQAAPASNAASAVLTPASSNLAISDDAVTPQSPSLNAASLSLALGTSFGYTSLVDSSACDDADDDTDVNELEAISATGTDIVSGRSTHAGRVYPFAPLVCVRSSGVLTINEDSRDWAALRGAAIAPGSPRTQGASTAEAAGVSAIAASGVALAAAKLSHLRSLPPGAAASLHTSLLAHFAQVSRRHALHGQTASVAVSLGPTAPRVAPFSRMFEYFLDVGRGELCSNIELAENASDIELTPAVLDRFPKDDWVGLPLPANAAVFAFPDGLRLERHVRAPEPSYFSFALTFEDGTKLACGALTAWERLSAADTLALFLDSRGGSSFRLPRWLVGDAPPGTPALRAALAALETEPFFTPRASILVSRLPIFSTIRATLSSLYSVSISGPPMAPAVRRLVAHLILDVPRPPRGYFSIGFTLGDAHIVVARPPTSALSFLDVPLAPLLQALDAQALLAAFTAVLTEQRVALCSTQPALLLPAAEALLSLLAPFRWVVNYIPVLPSALADILGAPTPYLIGWPGTVRDAEAFSSDTVFVDLDSGSVHVPASTPLPRIPEAQRKKLLRSLRMYGYGDHPLPTGANRSAALKAKVADMSSARVFPPLQQPSRPSLVASQLSSPLEACGVVSPGTPASSIDMKACSINSHLGVRLAAPWARSGRAATGAADPSPSHTGVLSASALGEATAGTSTDSPTLKNGVPSFGFGWSWANSGVGNGVSGASDDESGAPQARGAVSNRVDESGGGAESVNQPEEMGGRGGTLDAPYFVSAAAAVDVPVYGTDGSAPAQAGIPRGLSPNFDARAVRAAFLSLFVSLFKNYSRFVHYERLGTIPSALAALRVNRLIRAGCLRARIARDVASASGVESPTLPRPSTEKEPSTTQTPQADHVSSLGIVLPPSPMPCLEVVFARKAFLADAPSGARELLSALLETQLWSSFLQSLVPACYRAPSGNLPAGFLNGALTSGRDVASSDGGYGGGLPWDPSAGAGEGDPAFASRLPAGIRVFNGAIAAKLRRLATSRLSTFRFGGGRDGLSHYFHEHADDFLSDASAAIVRHVVIPVPPPHALPNDVAAAFMTVQSLAVAHARNSMAADTSAAAPSGTGALALTPPPALRLAHVPTSGISVLSMAGNKSTVKHRQKAIVGGRVGASEPEDEERRRFLHAERRKALRHN